MSPDGSKDLAEQVRTVHFALLALSFALMVVVLTNGKDELREAYRQARAIQAFSDAWDFGNSLEVYAKARIRIPTGKPERIHLRFLTPTELDTISPVTGVAVKLVPHDPVAVWMTHWPWSIVLPGYETDLSQEGLSRPTTLAQFKAFWNALPRMQLVTPNQPTSTAEIQVLQKGGGSLLVIGGKRFVNRPQEVFQWSELNDRLGQFQHDEFLRLIPRITTVYQMQVSEVDARAVYRGRLGDVIGDGLFQNVFPEMVEAAKNLEALPLSDLTTVTRKLSEAAGESVEAFGAKIPGANAARVGLGLILCVQLYLVLHLFEMRKMLRLERTAPAVAWIGLYDSNLARTLVAVSFCVPPVVIAFLSMRAVRYVAWGSPTIHHVVVAVLVLGCAISCFLALLAIRLRPRIGAEVA